MCSVFHLVLKVFAKQKHGVHSTTQIPIPYNINLKRLRLCETVNTIML